MKWLAGLTLLTRGMYSGPDVLMLQHCRNEVTYVQIKIQTLLMVFLNTTWPLFAVSLALKVTRYILALPSRKRKMHCHGSNHYRLENQLKWLLFMVSTATHHPWFWKLQHFFCTLLSRSQYFNFYPVSCMKRANMNNAEPAKPAISYISSAF